MTTKMIRKEAAKKITQATPAFDMRESLKQLINETAYDFRHFRDDLWDAWYRAEGRPEDFCFGDGCKKLEKQHNDALVILKTYFNENFDAGDYRRKGA